MTDTGQIPGEGQPENAGGLPGQPGVPAPGEYPAADPVATGQGGEEDDLLLMPGAQGWGSEPAQAAEPTRAPEPHEIDGRDSGSLDYGAVRT
ncbi:hypothetical protein, partial [Streptomyces sparsus]